MIGTPTVKCFRDFTVPKFDDAGVRVLWTSKRDIVLIGKNKTEYKFTS